MRALINATGYSPDLEPLILKKPTPLICLADKALIIHIVERLAQCGIHKLEVILHHLPEDIEKMLESGSRWGVEITYHLSTAYESPFSCVANALKQWPEKKLLLASGDALPAFTPEELKRHCNQELLFYSEKDEWTGWGLLETSTLASLASNLSFEDIPSHCKHYKRLTLSSSPNYSVKSFKSLQASHVDLLKAKNPGILFPSTAKKVEDGIWISRATTIHPHAQIKSPVFIGEHCHIGRKAIIGPNVMIENHSIVDSESHLTNSLVISRSYIGEKLDIHDSIIDKNSLINILIGSTLSIKDKHIVAELSSQSLRIKTTFLIERFVALLFFLLLMPVSAFCFFLYPLQIKIIKNLEDSHEGISIYSFSVDTPRISWLNISWIKKRVRILPQILNVFKGHLHFVGLSPRTEEEYGKLSSEWQHLLKKSKLGIINLTEIEKIDANESELMYLTEAYYSAKSGFLYDLSLIKHWFWNI
jgi:NDP-sugar pyrophosphorylase family protein